MALPENADIALCLVEVGHTENCSPDISSYAALSENWRGNGECPTEAELETAWVTVQANLATQEAQEEVAKTDASYIRVIDDIIDTLVTKGTITVADLPQAAQDKYNNRVTLRGQI